MRMVRIARATLMATAMLALIDCICTLYLDAYVGGIEGDPLLRADDGTADPVKVMVFRLLTFALNLASSRMIDVLAPYPRLLRIYLIPILSVLVLNIIAVVNNTAIIILHMLQS